MKKVGFQLVSLAAIVLITVQYFPIQPPVG
jgi:hypothetical protein